MTKYAAESERPATGEIVSSVSRGASGIIADNRRWGDELVRCLSLPMRVIGTTDHEVPRDDQNQELCRPPPRSRSAGPWLRAPAWPTRLGPVPWRPPRRLGGDHLFESFDVNDDGILTQTEIEEVRQSRLTEFDANGDGSLSLEEYQALWMEAMRERMVDRFQAHDDDGDGLVTSRNSASRSTASSAASTTTATAR